MLRFAPSDADKSTVKRLFLALVLTIILSPVADAVNCAQESLKKLHAEHSLVKPSPVSFQEYQKAISQLHSGGNKPKFLKHLKGDYLYMRDVSVPQVKVVSGLHTNEGIDFLKRMRPDLAADVTIRELPNGMQVATIPKAALGDRRLQSAPLKSKTVDGREIIFTEHTLFPKSWSETEIIEAVEKVRTNRASFRSVRDDATFITGTYKGVKIRIIIRDGEVRTAFPMVN